MDKFEIAKLVKDVSLTVFCNKLYRTGIAKETPYHEYSILPEYLDWWSRDNPDEIMGNTEFECLGKFYDYILGND